ncbi:MAG: hypothetical protein ABIL05_00315 [candidate division WOR-3 bacterium]
MLIEIAGLRLLIESSHRLGELHLPEVYEHFRASGEPDFTISLRYSKAPPKIDNRFRCRKSGILNLYRVRPGYYFFTFDRVKGLGSIEQEQRRFSFTTSALSAATLNLIVETVYISVTTQILHNYLILHACGVVDKDRAYLFSAPSNGGKSTIGKIVLNLKKVLLNDDRIIVCWNRDRIMAYGNPWHGELAEVNSRGMPLKKIFFLKKGQRNFLKKLRPMESVMQMMANAFFLPVDPGSKVALLNRCIDLASSVPAYELTFYPDEAVWRKIERK